MKTIMKTTMMAKLAKAALVALLATGTANVFTAQAQPMQSSQDSELDSASLEPVTIYYKNPVRATFLGYDLAVGTVNYQLHSNINALSGLKAGFFGGTAGGVLSNGIVKLKLTVGAYRTSSSVPYNIDLYQGSVSGSVYLLRLKEVKAHLFEPYVSLGVNYQQSLFYGYYLTNDKSVNYSTTEAPYLGQTHTSFGTIGAGVEYQLETDELRFVHLFVGASYSTPISTSSSNDAFSQTTFGGGLTINAGLSFGIIKYKKS